MTIQRIILVSRQSHSKSNLNNNTQSVISRSLYNRLIEPFIYLEKKFHEKYKLLIFEPLEIYEIVDENDIVIFCKNIGKDTIKLCDYLISNPLNIFMTLMI